MYGPADLAYIFGVECDLLELCPGRATPDAEARRLTSQPSVGISKVAGTEWPCRHIRQDWKAASVFRTNVEGLRRIADAGDPDRGKNLVDHIGHAYRPSRFSLDSIGDPMSGRDPLARKTNRLPSDLFRTSPSRGGRQCNP